MARLKIKSPNAKDPKRRELLEILSLNDIYVARIIPTNDGFVILTHNDEELDKIFNNTTDKQLLKKNFSPIIPPQLKATRSILIFRVDNNIFAHDENEIKEIIERNEWAEDVCQVFKFPSVSSFQISEFKHTQNNLQSGGKSH